MILERQRLPPLAFDSLQIARPIDSSRAASPTARVRTSRFALHESERFADRMEACVRLGTRAVSLRRGLYKCRRRRDRRARAGKLCVDAGRHVRHGLAGRPPSQELSGSAVPLGSGRAGCTSRPARFFAFKLTFT